MIERGAEITVARQAQLLALSRSSVYYTPRAVSERALELMRRIDALHLEWPFYGARKLARELRKGGHDVGRVTEYSAYRFEGGTISVGSIRPPWPGP